MEQLGSRSEEQAALADRKFVAIVPHRLSAGTRLTCVYVEAYEKGHCCGHQ